MDFEPHFKVHNLVSVHPKGTIFSQMINLNMLFHVVVSVYRLVKNSPQFPDEFRNGQSLRSVTFSQDPLKTRRVSNLQCDRVFLLLCRHIPKSQRASLYKNHLSYPKFLNLTATTELLKAIEDSAGLLTKVALILKVRQTDDY